MLLEESKCEMHTLGLKASLRYVKNAKLLFDSNGRGFIRDVWS